MHQLRSRGHNSGGIRPAPFSLQLLSVLPLLLMIMRLVCVCPDLCLLTSCADWQQAVHKLHSRQGIHQFREVTGTKSDSNHPSITSCHTWSLLFLFLHLNVSNSFAHLTIF